MDKPIEDGIGQPLPGVLYFNRAKVTGFSEKHSESKLPK